MCQVRCSSHKGAHDSYTLIADSSQQLTLCGQAEMVMRDEPTKEVLENVVSETSDVVEGML